MRRPAFLALAVLALAAACSSTSTDTGGAAGTTARPGTTAGTSTTTAVAATGPTAPAGMQRLVPWWMTGCPSPDTATEVGTCRVAAGEARLVPADADPVAEAMKALMAGPNDAEKAAGLTTNIRKATTLDSLSLEGDVATAGFNRYFETATSRPQVAQVVYTLTGVPGVAKVAFLIDGKPNGATGVPPVGRDAVEALTPPLSIDSPVRGDTVGPSFAVTGTAKVPDGKVSYRVEGPGGSAAPSLAEGTATVTAAAGKRGPLSFSVSVPAGTTGPATLVVFHPGPNGEESTAVVPLTIT